MGKWINIVRGPVIHEHDMPFIRPSDTTKPGSVWECSCKRRFKLSEEYEWLDDFSSYTLAEIVYE